MWWIILILIIAVTIVVAVTTQVHEPFTPVQVPSLVPVETTVPHCQYPYELVDRQCQLQCPADYFMANNPTITCQHAHAAYFRQPIEGHCQPGEQPTLEGCVKPLETCPSNYTMDEGVCVEQCPEGYVSTEIDAEFRRDDFLEKRRTRVCQLIPISRL